MKRKNALKGWQMGILTVLLVFMFSTMYIPAIRFDSDVFGDMCVKAIKTITGNSSLILNVFDTLNKKADDESKLDDEEREEFKEALQGKVDTELNDEARELLEEEFHEFEDRREINLTISLTPLEIMTHDLSSCFIPKDADKKDIKRIKKDIEGYQFYKKINSYYKPIRVLLIIHYLLLLVVLILVIAGFLVKWSKKIPLIFSIVYSAFSVLLFGFLRFGLIRAFLSMRNFNMDTVATLVEELFGVEKIGDKLMSFINTFVANIFSCMYSYSFLIAFIIALLLLAMSIVCLVWRNRAEVIEYDRAYDEYGPLTGGITSSAGGVSGMEVQAEPDFGNNMDYAGGMDYRNPLSQNQRPIKDDVAEDVFETIPVTDNSSPNMFDSIPVTSAQQAAPVPTPFINQAPAMGKVCCTKGVAVGQGFQLPSDRKVIVGKSPSRTNLTVNHPSVSNVHCSICYNPAKNTYIVKDHSTNGTFVNGSRLPKEVDVECPAGTVLVLADGVNEITLG